MDCATKFEENMREALERRLVDDYQFQGRGYETKKLQELFEKKRRIIWLHGMPKMGKSAFVLNCLNSYSEKDGVRMLYIDFEEHENLEKHLRKQVNVDSETGIDTSDLHEKFYQQVNAFNKDAILVLDNADKVDLQTFINIGFKRCRKLSFVVTSTKKMSFLKGFGSLEIGPLEAESVKALLQEVRNDSISEEDMVFIDALVVLCQGLPLAALYLGTEMNESEGLFTPSDMLELMIQNRYQALTSEYYPREDRPSDQCEKMFLKLNSAFKDMFMSLSTKVTDSSFTVNDALEASGRDTASNATVKKEFIQPMARQSVLSLANYQKDETIKLHGLLHDCIIIHKDHRDNTQEASRLSLERAKEVGLDIPEDAVGNPRQLAAFIAAMKDDSPKKEEGLSDDSEDSGTVDDLSDDSERSESSSRKSSDPDCIQRLQSTRDSNPSSLIAPSLSSMSGPMALSFQGGDNLSHLSTEMYSNQAASGAHSSRVKVQRNDSSESNNLNKSSYGSRSPSPEHVLDNKFKNCMNISGSVMSYNSEHKSQNCMATKVVTSPSESKVSESSGESNVRKRTSSSQKEVKAMPRGPPSGRYTPPAGHNELQMGRCSPDKQAVEHSENMAKCDEGKKQVEEKKLNI